MKRIPQYISPASQRPETTAVSGMRRSLLQGISSAGLVGTLPLSAAAQEPVSESQQALKYQENDYIRRFYDLARR